MMSTMFETSPLITITQISPRLDKTLKKEAKLEIMSLLVDSHIYPEFIANYKEKGKSRTVHITEHLFLTCYLPLWE